MQQEIIRTTARFQEAAEPVKQRPCIIQVEEAGEARAHLPNTVRASMDSQGRDNPFRPDGKIYKSADPIVDYYKHGPNQSRAQSPADALLSSARADEKKLDKDSNKKNRKTKVSNNREQEPCWRRWLCCRCCCCCKRKQPGSDEDKERIVISKQTKLVVVDQTNAVLEEPSHDHNHHKEQQPKKQQVSTTKTKPKTTAKAETKTTRWNSTQEEEESNQRLSNKTNDGNKRCIVS